VAFGDRGQLGSRRFLIDSDGMAKKARITLGVALIVASLAMIGSVAHWISVPLLLFAIFLVVWGRSERATETFIAKLPGGDHVSKWLRELDLILTPHDLKYEAHIERIIRGYDPLLQKSLLILKETRDPNSILWHDWERFNKDGLVEQLFSGPSGIKPELRDVVDRVLEDLRIV
jgi:hypothetical protein